MELYVLRNPLLWNVCCNVCICIISKNKKYKKNLTDQFTTLICCEPQENESFHSIWKKSDYFLQQMTSQELWSWVHLCYGDELGLTSSDDDYTPPTIEEKRRFELLEDQRLSTSCEKVSSNSERIFKVFLGASVARW